MASELEFLIVSRLPLFLPNVILDIFDAERDSSTSISGTESSTVWAAGEIRGLIEGTTGGISIGIAGTGGTSRGIETVNGVIRETAESLFESLCSTGDLIAIMLVEETGTLSEEIGDEGTEDTRLLILSCGKTDIPHLLAGRTGAGVNSGGVAGETGSDGGGRGDGRIATSADSLWSDEDGRLNS